MTIKKQEDMTMAELEVVEKGGVVWVDDPKRITDEENSDDHFVVQKLNEAIQTFKNKSLEYGMDSHKRHGEIMKLFFPNGVKLDTAADMTRFGLFDTAIAKFNRYAINFKSGGHPDSLLDIVVYTSILQDMDNDQN